MSDDRFIAVVCTLGWAFSIVIGLWFVDDKFAIFMSGVLCFMNLMLAISLWNRNGRGRGSS